MIPVYVLVVVILASPIGQNSTQTYALYSTKDECLNAKREAKVVVAVDKATSKVPKVVIAACLDSDGNVVTASPFTAPSEPAHYQETPDEEARFMTALRSGE